MPGVPQGSTGHRAAQNVGGPRPGPRTSAHLSYKRDVRTVVSTPASACLRANTPAAAGRGPHGRHGRPRTATPTGQCSGLTVAIHPPCACLVAVGRIAPSAQPQAWRGERMSASVRAAGAGGRLRAHGRRCRPVVALAHALDDGCWQHRAEEQRAHRRGAAARPPRLPCLEGSTRVVGSPCDVTALRCANARAREHACSPHGTQGDRRVMRGRAWTVEGLDRPVDRHPPAFSNGPHVRGRLFPSDFRPLLLPLARGAFPAGLAAEHGRTPVAGCGAGSVPGRARIGCELAGALVSPAARRLLRRRWRLRVSWDLCARPRARSAGPSACCRGSGIGGCQRGVPAERAAATYAGL